MAPIDGEGGLIIGDKKSSYLIYTQGKCLSVPVATGKYNLYAIDKQSGDVKLVKKSLSLKETFSQDNTHDNQLFWLRKL